MLPRVLVPFERELSRDPEDMRIEIHEFLNDTGVTVVWTAYAIPVFMMLYELAINAVGHGRAEHVWLACADGVVTIRDNGRAFGLAELRTGGRGAHLALTHLETMAAGSITVRYQHTGHDNAWSLVEELLSLGANTPCSLAPSGRHSEMFRQARVDLLALENCQEIHLYPPALWSVSDWFELAHHISADVGERVVLVHGVDPSVRWVVKQAFPQARLVD
jgi:hypothetical protein